MKKYIKLTLLVFIAVFLTGCKAKYNIEINDDEISENLSINNANFTDDQINAYTNNPVPVDINDSSFLDYDSDSNNNSVKEEGVNYYNIKFQNQSQANIKATMTVKQLNDSRIANSLFNNIHVNNYENVISIYGYNGLQAFISNPELEAVSVNIKVNDMKVTSNDADEVNNNVYSWYFTKDTNSDKTLYIEMSKTEKANVKKSKFNTGYIVLGVFFSCIIVLSIIKIYDLRRKN